MSIKDATPEEIAAMRERINKRQSDRRYEMEMDQAVAIACKANRVPFVEQGKEPSLESVIVATGMMATAGAAAILGSTGAVPMGYAVAAAGVAMAGAVTQVAREVQK
jgi:hypothetical protein